MSHAFDETGEDRILSHNHDDPNSNLKTLSNMSGEHNTSEHLGHGTTREDLKEPQEQQSSTSQAAAPLPDVNMETPDLTTPSSAASGLMSILHVPDLGTPNPQHAVTQGNEVAQSHNVTNSTAVAPSQESTIVSDGQAADKTAPARLSNSTAHSDIKEEDQMLDTEGKPTVTEAEWRYDSSDVESDTSSTSDSSDDSEEVEYDLLNPKELAQILMQDGGSEDGDGGRKFTNSAVRTTHEQAELAFPKPVIDVTPEMEIVELGSADAVVENFLLIKGKLSGETQVLESGSALCLADRRVIGSVFEPLGRVNAPMYSVGFENQKDILEMGIEIGTKIFYVKKHATYVFTQPLKLVKGSDASNLHDEEIGDEEIEFSDDEAEAAFKRKRKMDRSAKRDTNIAKAGRRESNYPEQPIRYEDDEADGLYRPLPRPLDLAESSHEAPPPRGFTTRRGRGWRSQGSNYSHGTHRAPMSVDSPMALPVPPPGYQHMQNNPPVPLPPGSFVNPAFFTNNTAAVQSPFTQAQHAWASHQQGHHPPPTFLYPSELNGTSVRPETNNHFQYQR